MKKSTNQIFIIAGLFLFAANVMAADYKSEKAKLSYAIGVTMANSLKQQKIDGDVDAKLIGEAIVDILGGKKLKVTQADQQAAMTAFQQKMMAKQKEAADGKKAVGDKFRAENKKRKGVTELPNGIQYEVLKDGKGDKPKKTDKVTVHYHGTLIDGTVFDSSTKRGKPASFPLNGVIKGWQEVLPLMPTGAKWKVVIPPELAYGERGAGGSIGPNETLIFEIELISIDK
ncbi:FKBP-type peptidyl-prolyl cis-trans isomerase FklB [hydrothermal vent metagenome]|uniref:peptidylprolyl isomerase n=1 Tax=hydrothermal vent metagenome TaxID=652676 RepID=A0A3B1AA08_9ZZZZ